MKAALFALIIASISSAAMAYTCSFTIENLGDDDHFGDWFLLRVKTDAKGKSVVLFTDLNTNPELGNVAIMRKSQCEKGTGKTIKKQATTWGKMTFRFVSDRDLSHINAGTYDVSVNVSVFCGALARN